MRNKIKSKLFINKEIFIPKYKVEKKYFPLFKNENLRNNQNYILGNKDNKLIQFYSQYTFIWGSILRVISKKGLINFRNKKIKEFGIIIFFSIIFLFFSYLGLIVSLVFFTSLLLISLFGFIGLIYGYYKKGNKNIIIIKNKNKYIILNKGKIKSLH